MKRVIIESPLAAETEEGRERNREYARRAVRHSLSLGEAPLASHLLFVGVLHDEVPEERENGILAGFAWGSVADEVAVYLDLGISKGMEQGIDRAFKGGQTISYRSLRETPFIDGFELSRIRVEVV